MESEGLKGNSRRLAFSEEGNGTWEGSGRGLAGAVAVLGEEAGFLASCCGAEAVRAAIAAAFWDFAASSARRLASSTSSESESHASQEEKERVHTFRLQCWCWVYGNTVVGGRSAGARPRGWRSSAGGRPKFKDAI